MGAVLPKARFMDQLPTEVYFELSKYFSSEELKVLRAVNKAWNDAANFTLRRRRGAWIFEFHGADTLSRFLDTFMRYSPREDLATAHYIFMFPAFGPQDAFLAVTTFGRTLGQHVTRLTLDFDMARWDHGAPWFTPRERDLLTARLTFLFGKVKGQLQELTLTRYAGLNPTVLGSEPFPVLRSLTVSLNDRLAADRSLVEPIADTEEAFLLELSRKVPALQEFDLDFFLSTGSDPAVVPSVLRNLATVNPNVNVKLTMVQTVDLDHGPLFEGLMTVPVRVKELTLTLNSARNQEDMGPALNWIEGLSDCLVKLDYLDEADTENARFAEFPRMRALEELKYGPENQAHVIAGSLSDNFPNLRSFHGSDIL